MAARTIMVQGTGSHVGKSVIVAALCRIFSDDGYAVCPYKAQNMARPWVTRTGDEMSLAQAAQAEAARVEPAVEMNPVLLKPEGDARCQVIVLGKAIGTMAAAEYLRGYAGRAARAAREALGRLMRLYEIVVMEGAGSPAEVNLRRYDFVNMRAARWAGAPVLLVADIDRGGALAAVVGTLELLREEERRLVAGIIINKFRGDRETLEPGLAFLRRRTRRRVLGVIPYIGRPGVPEEDSLGGGDEPGHGQSAGRAGPESHEVRDAGYSALAEVVRRSLDMDAVYSLLGLGGGGRGAAEA